MKEMGETIFPSYKVGLFLVELPCDTWQALEKDSDESIKAECTLLHEYIHYIQDTATYYGVLYRNATYMNESTGAAASEIVGANIVETEGMQSDVTVADGKLMYGNHVAGTKLMKENMAVVAQHYAFDDVCTVVIPTNNNYSAITHYIWREVPCLRYCYLLTFSLYDMALCSEHPVDALLQLIGFFQKSCISRKSRYYEEEELVGWLYDKGEEFLEASGLLDYSTIKNANKIDGDISRILDDSMATLPCECGKVENHQRKFKLFSYFKQKVRANLALRINRPTIITRTLIELKQRKDMEVFYKTFGMPYMLNIDENGEVHTNVDLFFNR